jgi:hypothetical protein
MTVIHGSAGTRHPKRRDPSALRNDRNPFVSSSSSSTRTLNTSTPLAEHSCLLAPKNGHDTRIEVTGVDAETTCGRSSRPSGRATGRTRPSKRPVLRRSDCRALTRAPSAAGSWDPLPTRCGITRMSMEPVIPYARRSVQPFPRPRRNPPIVTRVPSAVAAWCGSEARANHISGLPDAGPTTSPLGQRRMTWRYDNRRPGGGGEDVPLGHLMSNVQLPSANDDRSD